MFYFISLNMFGISPGLWIQHMWGCNYHLQYNFTVGKYVLSIKKKKICEHFPYLKIYCKDYINSSIHPINVTYQVIRAPEKLMSWW